MSSSKLVLQGAAGALGGEALNVEDVFSNYLYVGNSSTQSIINGIDLDGEGGLVWIKTRNSTQSHNLVDTERGDQKRLLTNSTQAQIADSDFGTFLSNGFSLDGANQMNYTGNDHVSWTFRKAPKFFTCLTYTGTGVNRTISHDLGSTPGMIIVKRTDSTSDWACYHRRLNGGTNPATKFIRLNLNNAQSGNSGYWNNTEPTDSVFSVGANAATNANGGTYVAYLFAHNDGDGEFGPDSDADIIKCGSYTGNGGTQNINLGFEPQWVMFKRYDSGDNWYILDSMRGFVDATQGDRTLIANDTNAEQDLNSNFFGSQGPSLTATGFRTNAAALNGNTGKYLYIAIRRGPMAVPEDADDVFDVTTWTSSGEPKFQTSFASDMAMNRNVDSSYDMRIAARLTQGKFLKTNTTNSESSNSNFNFDYMNGFLASGGNSSFYSWQWKRAPNYFDVVTYTGNGTSGRTVNHNLGVAPEMMWVKVRSATNSFMIYHKDLTAGHALYLNYTFGSSSQNTTFNSTDPTDSVFTLGSAQSTNSSSGYTYIAYLFASLDGVSKVGSYTGNGSSDGDTQDIDCGFTSGARFVLIKRTSSTGNWMLYDTERGIVSSGDDKRLELNGSGAQDTNENCIEPLSSGFTVRWDIDSSASNNPNISGSSYIFYAIA